MRIICCQEWCVFARIVRLARALGIAPSITSFSRSGSLVSLENHSHDFLMDSIAVFFHYFVVNGCDEGGGGAGDCS